MVRPENESDRSAEDDGSSSDANGSALYLTKISLKKDPLSPRPPYDRRQRLAENPVPPPQLHERDDDRFKLQTPQVLILGFGLIILIGTLLLKLPQASATGESIGWIEALFTSTSATTVTGLVVLNTATDFSFFGQVIILVLLQVGGVGFISFSVLLFRLIGRRVTLNERFIVQHTLGASGTQGVVGLALFVLAVTLALEAIGALFLWLRWRSAMPDLEAFWYALFHAISSYCNAGFDLFSGTEHGVLFGFGTDSYTLFVMGVLILLGGFGIAILYDLGTYYRDRSLSLNTRLTLLIAAVLTIIGTGIMLLDHRLYSDVLSGASFGEQFAVSLFTIVSARTAGLTIVPLESLSQTTQLIIMLWMFIGGAPASMAGGVSTGTAGVLLIAVIATARGRQAAVAFGRTIPTETVAKAVAIMTVSTLLVTLVTLALSLLRQGDIFLEGFEVVSAFANAGYSLAFTSSLDNIGRLLIAFTMFWGRLGPLTIVVALAESEQPALVGYPEEPVILG